MPSAKSVQVCPASMSEIRISGTVRLYSVAHNFSISTYLVSFRLIDYNQSFLSNNPLARSPKLAVPLLAVAIKPGKRKNTTTTDLNEARDNGVWGWQWPSGPYAKSAPRSRQITTPTPPHSMLYPCTLPYHTSRRFRSFNCRSLKSSLKELIQLCDIHDIIFLQ